MCSLGQCYAFLEGNFYATAECQQFLLPDSLTLEQLRVCEKGHARQAAGALRYFSNRRRRRYSPTLLSALRDTECWWEFDSKPLVRSRSESGVRP